MCSVQKTRWKLVMLENPHVTWVPMIGETKFYMLKSPFPCTNPEFGQLELKSFARNVVEIDMLEGQKRLQIQILISDNIGSSKTHINPASKKSAFWIPQIYKHAELKYVFIHIPTAKFIPNYTVPIIYCSSPRQQHCNHIKIQHHCRRKQKNSCLFTLW